MERESLRLLLSLNPFDLLPNVAERVGWSSFRMAGVADIGLSSYSPFRRRAPTLFPILKT